MEDLFYNVQTRKNALKSASEEHNRIVEVVTRFAVHNASVGFSLKKLNDNGADVRTSPNSSHVDNIRVLYGNTVAKDLVQLQVEDAHLKIKGMHIILYIYLFYDILILRFVYYLFSKWMDIKLGVFRNKGHHVAVYQ